MKQSRFLVLIVDEDRELCRSLAAEIAQAGYQVECLVTGGNPLAAIRDLAPDLVLLDIPRADSPGLTILRQLETHRHTRHTPVIVTSRLSELEYELLDVFDFLPKPLDRHRLFEDLAQLAAKPSRLGQELVAPMQEEELRLFQDFLITHSGLHFDRRNFKILERGLIRRMRAIGSRTYRDYYDYLERHGESRQELKKLLGLLTVGETYFFRYLAHFEALEQEVLPELIARNRPQRRLRIWSAGCSTGEEPYSIAILLLDRFPELRDWDLRILGTDINKRALRRAREALYGPRALRVTDPRLRSAYFRAEGDFQALLPEVRRLVDFGYLNLQTGSFPAAETGTTDLDIIFCRNVLIYFTAGTNRAIIDRFSRCLKPGGFLFLGHAETLQNLSQSFQRVHQAGGFFYRLRPAETAAEATLKPPPKPAPPPMKPLPARPTAAPPKPVLPPAPAEPATPDLAEVFARAEMEFNHENFKTASQDYDTILRHAPRHVGALVGRGFILANQGDYPQALASCAEALAVDDLYPPAYFLRGLIHEMEGELAVAADEYRKALLLDLQFIMPHYNLSKVYRRLDRLPEARRELRNTLRLLELTPDETTVPYSGGLTRAVFLEICREDAGDAGRSASGRRERA